MKFWWLTDFRRLAEERSAIDALADEGWFALGDWTLDGYRLAVDGVIAARGSEYPVRLIYPDQFPLVPAWVEPREEARWSDHQYGEGVLCLQHRPDNWTAGVRGADMLRSAYDLLSIENPLGEGGEKARAPSEHNIGALQAYEWGANPVLVSAGSSERLLAASAEDVRAVRFLTVDDVWPIVLHDAEDRVSVRRPPGTDFTVWRTEIPVFIAPVNVSKIEDRAALVAAAPWSDDEIAAINACEAGVAIFTGGDSLCVYHLFNDGGMALRRVYVLPDDSAARSGRASVAKRVALVGAGSVGSKIAASLVRGGVAALTIIDGDVMLPGNIERHELDWRDVGFRKASGLKRRLLNIAPGADIKVVEQNLNWQRSAKTHAWQVDELAACDVIVDATGDAATALFLGAIAAANARSFVSVEVFEGGIGALVARSVAGQGPPFEKGRAAFLAWCAEQPAARPTSGVKRYEALAEDGTPMTADDAAVGVAAAHAARAILDIIDGAEVSTDWLLIGLKKGWVFDGHGATIRLNVGFAQAAEDGGDDDNAAIVEQGQAFGLKLLRTYVDALKNSA